VWSFGVIAFELMTGTSLFKLDNTDNVDGGDELHRLKDWSGLSASERAKVLP